MAGSEITGKLFTKKVRGLPSGFSLSDVSYDLLLTHHYLRLALYFLPMLHALPRGSPRRQ